MFAGATAGANSGAIVQPWSHLTLFRELSNLAFEDYDVHFDMGQLSGADRYKVIGACVTPRPIAWVTSLSEDGVLNVSPFSFFNAIGDEPPVLVLGMVAHHEGRLKDTPSNIRTSGEFVVNLVDEHHAQAMNLTSIDAPPEVDEAALAGLQLAKSQSVKPPRIATAPVSFECRTQHFIETGPNQVAVVGEILHAHVLDHFVIDPDRIRLDIPAMKLISRLHGRGWYGRQTDTFEMLRPSWKAYTSKG